MLYTSFSKTDTIIAYFAAEGVTMMKMISWNVNGLRACLKKDFAESMAALDPDIICLQETKMQKGQADVNLPGYHQFWNSADKKGYSGVAIFSKLAPLSVQYGLGIDEFDHEGRVIIAEFESFFFVGCYTPNAQDELRRLAFRMRWDDAFRHKVSELDASKPVILCGDLNVAHQEIDLKNPRTNRRNAGFTDEERGKFSELLGRGFLDSFRFLYPDRLAAYSWWSYIGGARARNAGWRIDYFVVSERLAPRIADAAIHPEIFGSDHCPVELLLHP